PSIRSPKRGRTPWSLLGLDNLQCLRHRPHSAEFRLRLSATKDMEPKVFVLRMNGDDFAGGGAVGRPRFPLDFAAKKRALGVGDLRGAPDLAEAIRGMVAEIDAEADGRMAQR